MRWNRTLSGLLGSSGSMSTEVCICGMFDFVVESRKMDCVSKPARRRLRSCSTDGGGEGEPTLPDGLCTTTRRRSHSFCDVPKDRDALSHATASDRSDLLTGSETQDLSLPDKRGFWY